MSNRKERTEKDKTETLLGKVRALEKRLKIAERENQRLAKYIKTREFELNGEDGEESVPESTDKRVCTSNNCGSTDFFRLAIPSKTGQKIVYTCKKCGHREKVSK